MTDSGISPLSGLPLKWNSDVQEGFTLYFGEPIGAWASSLNFNPEPGPNGARQRPTDTNAPFQIGELNFNPSQLEKLKALAMGKAFQAAHRGLKFPLFASATEFADLTAGKRPTPHDFQPIPIGDLRKEAQNLTLSEKANETLRNLADSEPVPGFTHHLALRLGHKDGDAPEPSLDAPERSRATSLLGLAYAAVKGERTLVFESLLDQNLITIGPAFDYVDEVEKQNQLRAGNLVRVTPKGYELIERLRKGDLGVTRKAFLVCRYNPEFDVLFADTYKLVGELDDVKCPILRVKDIHHVDKIDDRILHEIKEATVVVVDLSDTRKDGFNVAFEAGLALALNKPIVWTMREPLPKQLPFDIQSHNILPYNPKELEEFKSNLKYRLLAALDKAGAGH